ncbi:MAG: hypothetical protein KAI61_08570 [Alphaproteobacteria bacterium]|nr:hypothetical protein [Alphaproteobacteria bacterium]
MLDAVTSGETEAVIAQNHEYNYHGEACGFIPNTVNIDRTILTVVSIKLFLKSRGFITGFFFPESVVTNEFLDPAHQYYAPKLAATVNAWTAVSSDNNLLNGKTPKQAMEKWLREHASQFSLTKDDGNPNETGIEEICKIANWRPEGGAAKTPNASSTTTPANSNPPTPKKTLKLKKIEPVESLIDDSEIPF